MLRGQRMEHVMPNVRCTRKLLVDINRIQAGSCLIMHLGTYGMYTVRGLQHESVIDPVLMHHI